MIFWRCIVWPIGNSVSAVCDSISYIRKRLFVVGLAAVLVPALAAAKALHADDAENALKTQVHHAFPTKNFADIEEKASRFRREKTRFQSGRWQLDAIYEDFYDVGVIEGAGKYFASYMATFDEWHAAYPNSATPVLAKANYLIGYAWHFRGPGFVASVAEENWRPYRENLEKAYTLLNEAPDLVRQDPFWYSLMVQAMNDLGMDKAIIGRLALHGFAAQPDYYTTQAGMIRTLSPMWGGSLPLMSDWIKRITALPQAADSPGLYARLYRSARKQLTRQDFNKLNIDWVRMKSETDAFLKTYPSEENFVAALEMSCNSYDPIEVRMRHEAIPNGPRKSHLSDAELAKYCRWTR